jgi:hypothetical protein
MLKRTVGSSAFSSKYPNMGYSVLAARHVGIQQ